MANTWWVLIPQGDQSQPDSYKEQVDFRLQFAAGSSQDKALRARQPVNWGGQTLVYWKGPFATEAQAKAAQNPQPAPNPVDVAKRALRSANPLAGLFQANIWERVALVGLGIILIAVGVAQLTHAVPLATKIATAVK